MTLYSSFVQLVEIPVCRAVNVNMLAWVGLTKVLLFLKYYLFLMITRVESRFTIDLGDSFSREFFGSF